MLSEIKCDKFLANGAIRPAIRFTEGLNVVLGDSEASNSIGKSTFLLVVDFAFGGKAYIENAPDILKNVGPHTIQFAFEFSGQKHKFSRSTSEYLSVNCCDNDYNVIKTIPLADYCDWLRSQYGMSQVGLTFRSAFTRYSRIYQKENLNEKRPLESVKDEPDRDAVLALLKLFDKFGGIKDAKDVADEAQRRVQAYRDGIKFEFIPSISGVRERKVKERELFEQRQKRDNISDPGALAGKSAEDAMRVAELKYELQKLRAAYSRAQSRVAQISANMNGEQIPYCEDFKEFAAFFPNADMRKLSEVEQFHMKLSSILKDEMEEEKASAEKESQSLQERIGKVEDELGAYDVPTGISKKVLTEFADADRKVREIETQIANFDEKGRLQQEAADYKQRYSSLLQSDLRELQTSISFKMKELNDYIYGADRKPPIISLESNSYKFETPDDSGTGTSCKSLVVFDLAILNLTNLPALIHDSVLLKNIGDEPMEKILELYSSSQKQIFIALDKSDSYSQSAAAILDAKSVVKLSKSGNELFGRSWNRIEQK